MIETDTGDKVGSTLTRIYKGQSCKELGGQIPGVEIVDANSTRQERP